MTSIRSRTLVLSVAAVLSGCCVTAAVIAVVDPVNLRHNGAFAVIAVGGLFAFLTLLFAMWPKWPRAARAGTATGVAILGALLVAPLGWLTVSFAPTEQDVSHSPRRSNGVYLAVSQVAGALAIDYAPQLTVRRGAGLFRQESVVYRGPEDGTPPKNVRFVGPDRIAFTVGECTYRARYDPETLRVDNTHIPDHADAC